jgi:tryptophanyl-tRNA synthetase
VGSIPTLATLVRNIQMKKRILTGDRPSGRLHLGHFVGSLANRVKLQNEYEQYILIADVQALTDNFANPQIVADSVKELVLDYVAAGINPELSTIVVQSKMPAIAELTVFYMNLVSLNRVLRNPTVKAEIEQKGYGESIPAGFAMYPVSQAADITAFAADLVPVGDDQLPMVEQTREIVRKFNSLYGDVLKEPEALLGDYPRLVGTDGKAKMSKSLDNCIYLSDSAEEVQKKVMGMYTDPKRLKPTDPGTVEGNPVFVYHEAFNPNKEEVEDLKKRYRAGQVGDVEVKQKLIVALNNMLEPMRTRRAEMEKNPEKIEAILRDGVKKGREITDEVLTKVKSAMKIEYNF